MSEADLETPAPRRPAAATEVSGTDALLRRLRRNAALAMVVVTMLVAAVWREPMAVLGALLAGALVLLNFVVLESVTGAVLDSAKPRTNPLQLLFLAFRIGLMALMLYGIFAVPGVRPIPVALGLSILVLAVIAESVSQLFSASSSPD